MVNHPILFVEPSECIPAVSTVLSYILVAESESHVSHDDIIRLNRHWIVSHADTVARGSLSCYRHIANRQVESRFQMNCPRYIKHYSLDTFLRASPSQCSSTTIVGK